MNSQPENKSLTPGMNGRSPRFTTRKLTTLAILTAIAYILMFAEVTPPFVPVFLKLDFSEIPVLLGAFAFGPASAVLIELIKNLLHLPMTATAGVGELANFLAGSLFAGTAGIIYRYRKNHKGAILAMAVGTLVMTLFSSLFNYFFMIDFYSHLYGMPMDTIVAMGSAVNKYVTDLKTLILWAFAPFNVVKGIMVAFFTGLIYKPLSPILHGRHGREEAKKRVS
jgi:riboflavin transporter